MTWRYHESSPGAPFGTKVCMACGGKYREWWEVTGGRKSEKPGSRNYYVVLCETCVDALMWVNGARFEEEATVRVPDYAMPSLGGLSEMQRTRVLEVHAGRNGSEDI